MPNEKHVELFFQGSDVWNEWRQRHQDIVPDLSMAILSGSIPEGTSLSWINLSRANLFKADLSDLRLDESNLSEATLVGADLRHTDLQGANLSRARLAVPSRTSAIAAGASLARATLTMAQLDHVNLQGADLTEADLSDASLCYADLSGSKLRCATLLRANLLEVNFTGTDLEEARITNANLNRASLNGASLTNTDLRSATLIDAKLDKANLTGARLWSTQRDAWSIMGVTCKHAFWDREAQERTDYEPGEFERLYSEGLTVAVHYNAGIRRIEVNTLPMLLQHLEKSNTGCVLHLKSIQDAPGGAEATIVVEETGEHDPAELQARLQEQAQTQQEGLRWLIDQNPQLLDQLWSQMSERISEGLIPKLLEHAVAHDKALLNIETIEKVGILGNVNGNAKVDIDQ